MRLYTLSKRHFVLMFVVFFVCFGLTVFVGIEGKSVFSSSFHLQHFGSVASHSQAGLRVKGDVPSLCASRAEAGHALYLVLSGGVAGKLAV